MPPGAGATASERVASPRSTSATVGRSGEHPSPMVAWADLEARLILWQEGGRFSGLARSIDAATAALADADTDGHALLSFALRRAASFHLAVAPLPPAPESSNLRDALQRCLEGVNDPVAARWRRALQR